MVEEEDISQINTFDYRLVLPIDEASPPNQFKILFNCNGIQYTSPACDTASDVLSYVNDELELFGTWTIVSDVLYLSDSLCEVSSLGVQTVR